MSYSSIRSLSPWRSRSRERKEERKEEKKGGGYGLAKNDGEETDGESDQDEVTPTNNAYESDEDLSSTDEEDLLVSKNTGLNGAFEMDALPDPSARVITGEGSNFQLDEVSPFAAPVKLKRRGTKSRHVEPLKIVHTRAVFDRNRCTVGIVSGNPDAPELQQRRRRTYMVASDLSEESSYALQWAIGTILRDGDELLFVTVLETEEKLDGDENSASDKKEKLVWQRIRQTNAATLSRQATALIERTKLNVTISCQAVHTKNARHHLLDIIASNSPTLVIIGSRGLSKIKGILLGSVSFYLVQKASAPVMVCRRPLRLTRTVHKSKSLLNRTARMTIADAEIDAVSPKTADHIDHVLAKEEMTLGEVLSQGA